ncbi:MAG: hypothetical protein WCJ85_02790 [Chitinophagaceae bacterium]
MRFLILVSISLLQLNSYSQDSLPSIVVKNINGQIIISWKNSYAVPVTNISIQRSYDTLKNYSTIGSVLSPMNRENGYADTKPPYNKMYYRLFISFEGGKYVFSAIRRPIKEFIPPPVPSTSTTPVELALEPIVVDSSSKNNSLISPAPIKFNEDHSIKVVVSGSIAVRHIYIGKENNIIINIPDAGRKKYSLLIYNSTNQLLFTVKKITEPYLILERTNFLHAGWFRYELMEGGKLTEQNNFYVFKDSKPQPIPLEEKTKFN